MAVKKSVGELIKEARTNAGLSQEKLAVQIDGLSASDISKAERGEKQLTQAQLKAIAKATGVTQKSLLEAAGTTAGKTSSSSDAYKLTATEKKLVDLYRAADTDTKKAALALLKGEKTQMGGILSSLLSNKEIMNAVSTLFSKE